jgi:hypothetical protein
MRRSITNRTSVLLAVFACSLFIVGCGDRSITASSQLYRGGNAEVSKALSGFYVNNAVATTIYGYKEPNRDDGSPACTIRGLLGVERVALDQSANVIVPDGNSHVVMIYRGPNLCGRLLGSIVDQWGQPVDAASFDAATGTIFVADLSDGSGTHQGSIVRCTLAKGCGDRLTNPKLGGVISIALARSGDCWALTANSTGPNLALWYFKACEGSGERSSDFSARQSGNLDVDSAGNVVVIYQSSFPGYKHVFVTVYHGCDPHCERIGGPFVLGGGPGCGHLSKDSASLAIAIGNASVNKVDVYKYSPAALTYSYSFKTPPTTAYGTCVATAPRSSG